nr:MAG TPA: hypothetical protein [Podoviridae sp. ctY3D12]
MYLASKDFITHARITRLYILSICKLSFTCINSQVVFINFYEFIFSKFF